jgi:hypothetical protein
MDKDRPLSGSFRYGKKYWCIKGTASRDGEIYLMADRLEVTGAGALIAWGGYRAKTNDAPNPDTPVLALAAGSWTVAYEAEATDGTPLAVEHYKRGQVT